MFKGQKYQPNTNFEFVNYEQSSAGVFREPKKPKLTIPNTWKFQLPNSPPKSNASNSGFMTSKILAPKSQTHTFVADQITNTPKTSRKASYTVSTSEQKTKLVELIQKHRVYSCKPKLDAWNEVVKNYNKFYNLNYKEGLTIQHARVKLNQIITAAENKPIHELSNDEKLALEYDRQRQQFKYDNTKDIKIDKRYENKNPKLTKVYELITELQARLEEARDSSLVSLDNSFKNELWLLHKRVLDLKTIEEQYQILEQVDYNKDGTRVKVSKEMRGELFAKAQDIESSLDTLLKTAEQRGNEDQETSAVGDDFVDTELLDKK